MIYLTVAVDVYDEHEKTFWEFQKKCEMEPPVFQPW